MALDALFEARRRRYGVPRRLRPRGARRGLAPLLHLASRFRALAVLDAARPGVPNGFTEWLICESIDWARDAGYARVSLNFSPFAALLAPGATLRARSGVGRGAARD